MTPTVTIDLSEYEDLKKYKRIVEQKQVVFKIYNFNTGSKMRLISYYDPKDVTTIKDELELLKTDYQKTNTELYNDLVHCQELKDGLSRDLLNIKAENLKPKPLKNPIIKFIHGLFR